MNCPICDSVLKYGQSVTDGGTVSEAKTSCENGCYHKEFLYGTTELTLDVNGFGYETLNLGWLYSESPETAALREKLIEAFTAYAQKMGRWVDE